MLVGCWLGNYSMIEVTYGLQLPLDAMIHLNCEVTASLHFLAVKLGLVDVMVALAIASGYLFHCDASLRCAQLLLGAGY
jgi:hypothetical protein